MIVVFEHFTFIYTRKHYATRSNWGRVEERISRNEKIPEQYSKSVVTRNYNDLSHLVADATCKIRPQLCLTSKHRINEPQRGERKKLLSSWALINKAHYFNVTRRNGTRTSTRQRRLTTMTNCSLRSWLSHFPLNVLTIL